MKSNEYYTNCVCILALGTQHAMRILRNFFLWPAPLYIIFPHYLTKVQFSKKVIEHKMCVSSFSTRFVWNIFHSKKNWARYDGKCQLVTLYSYRFNMKLEFSRHIFEKSSNIEFHENLSSGSWVVPCGQTDWRADGHDEANSRFSQFFEHA